VIYSITHRTTYSYGAAVAISQHLAHLQPRPTPLQELLEFSLSLEPHAAASAQRSDYYGNLLHFITVEAPHRKFEVVTRSRIRIQDAQWPDPNQTPPWETVRDCQRPDSSSPNELPGEFLFRSPHVRLDPRYADYALGSFLPGRPLLAALNDLIQRIHRDFTFDSRATTIATPLEEVFQRRRGVCQDFAHLALACLRSLGLPARYVSGYLETMPPAGRARLIGADASHAWVALWCPGHGWIDADPTNNMLTADRHITLAWGRDFSDVSPLRGVVVGGGALRLSVGVDVARSQD
jgi:transglutaminase-like putative cysteine protease